MFLTSEDEERIVFKCCAGGVSVTASRFGVVFKAEGLELEPSESEGPVPCGEAATSYFACFDEELGLDFSLRDLPDLL